MKEKGIIVRGQSRRILDEELSEAYPKTSPMLSMPAHLPESQEKSRNSDRWAASKLSALHLDLLFRVVPTSSPSPRTKRSSSFDVSGLLYLLERHAGLATEGQI